VPLAGAAERAVAAGEVPLGADDLADGDAADLATDLDDLSREFVTEHERRLDAPLGPVVPVIDVGVGPADAGGQGPDGALGRADRRDGNVANREAFARALLDDGLHRDSSEKSPSGHGACERRIPAECTEFPAGRASPPGTTRAGLAAPHVRAAGRPRRAPGSAANEGGGRTLHRRRIRTPRWRECPRGSLQSAPTRPREVGGEE